MVWETRERNDGEGEKGLKQETIEEERRMGQIKGKERGESGREEVVGMRGRKVEGNKWLAGEGEGRRTLLPARAMQGICIECCKSTKVQNSKF